MLKFISILVLFLIAIVLISFFTSSFIYSPRDSPFPTSDFLKSLINWWAGGVPFFALFLLCYVNKVEQRVAEFPEPNLKLCCTTSRAPLL